MNQRIVITGMGWVTPLGHEIELVWSRLLKGESGIAPTTRFDASTFPTQFASEVKPDYDFRQFVTDASRHEGILANTAYALGAATQAWKMAGLVSGDEENAVDPYRVGLYLGAGEGPIDFEGYVAANLAGWNAEKRAVDPSPWYARGRQAMQQLRELEQESNMAAQHVAMELNASGPTYNCLTACAASTQAIGEASQILQRGDADVMIAGGTHSMIHPLGVTGFNRLTALSTRNDAPATASRPFSRDRDGFVLGEGSGIVILETLEHALARGAKPLAEIAGYGASADAYRITDMHPEGRGPAGAMERAFEDAGLTMEDIDYISVHGTGTKENDSIETRAIKRVFGDRAKRVPMSSIKSMMGHLIAAAGAVELITCILALRDQMLPPTINLHDPDPECDLDYVPNEARQAKVDICLSNNYGFGGQNNTLILKKFSV